MKKYFISNTDEEVKFGDELELTMTKFEDGVHQVRVDHYKFTKEIAPTLIAQGVIEVEDTEENAEEDTHETKEDVVKDKSTIDFSEDDDSDDTHEDEDTDEDEDDINEFMEASTDAMETMGICIKSLGGRVADLEAEVNELKEQVKALKEDKFKYYCRTYLKEDDKDADIIKGFNNCINFKYICDFFPESILGF